MNQESLLPDTTKEEDLVTEGQRHINRVWEYTQAAIAILVCLCTMIAGVLLVIARLFYDSDDQQLPTIFAVAFGTVIGFYFSRTNHSSTGGVGKQPPKGKYQGR